MIEVDGSCGEGGGQILRTSLALSLVTGKPFHIRNVRSRRKKPGLMRQHLTAVNAAAEIGAAELQGNIPNSQELFFAPQKVSAGSYHFSVGSAGSTTLVLQTVLPALLIAREKSELILEGGTHNPLAPPFDFIKSVFLPIINRMGPQVTATLDRPGFYPAGGGRCVVSLVPVPSLFSIELSDRGAIRRCQARAVVSRLSRTISDRELAVIGEQLQWDRRFLIAEEVASPGPGNVVTIEIESDHITEMFTAFGQKGVRAEKVPLPIIEEVKEYVSAGVPVGRHLADQLIIPLAMAGSGKFRTLPLTRHTATNIEVVKLFLNCDISVTGVAENACEVIVRSG